MKYGAEIRARVEVSEKAPHLQPEPRTGLAENLEPTQSAENTTSISLKPEYVITPQEWELQDSETACLGIGAKLPKIQTPDEKDAVRTLAVLT